MKERVLFYFRRRYDFVKKARRGLRRQFHAPALGYDLGMRFAVCLHRTCPTPEKVGGMSFTTVPLTEYGDCPKDLDLPFHTGRISEVRFG